MTDTSKKESQLQVVVITLLEAAGDKDHEVRESVIASLKKIAKKHSSFVLKSAVTFRQKNTKLSSAHLTGLLQTMEQICRNHLEDIKVDIIVELIEFSVQEMTHSADYQPEFQMPASGILVALGQTHCNEVMGGLLKQFHPGVVPHYSVLHTMGALASANAFGIVPFIKATLGTMLPMLGMLRTDAQKQVFAFTLGKFSEAVLEYLANIDQAPDSSVKKEAFSTEISIAYDILVNSWIHIKEPKVCVVVLQSLGPMFHLLPPVKVSEQVPRVIPVLLGLYRRNMDPLAVTQCLCAVLEVALKQNKTTVEPLLDNLQNIIFDLVCISPDYAQPATAKNHYEVLRCFDCIATYFADKVVELLIQQLKNNNEKERIKALFVVTHLVNSSENLIRSRTSDLTMALKNMLGEHNVKVKRILLKAIVAFAYRGYLEGSEGKDFVEFIVKHCCPQTTNMTGKDPDFGSLIEELQMTCANTLYLLATTVPQVEQTLWLILLQCLLTSQYTVACSHIARCLAHLATKRKDEHNFTEHSTKLSQEGTGPHVVLGRCLVLLGNPLKSKRGEYILHFLKNYVPNISRHLMPLWEQKIPELITYLEGYKGTWKARVWEDMILDFLSATLSEMDEEKWTMGLGVKLMEQVSLYTNYPEERCMLYKLLAVTVCHTMDPQFINHQLDVMLSSMKQQSFAESKACARAVGICSRNHLELVLLRLEKLSKEELSRKSSRMLLGFMKDTRQEGEMERVRLALLLCYAEVALEAPGTELIPQLERGITQWVTEQLHAAKEPLIREASLKAIGNIAEAVHPNRNSLHIVLQTRSQMLNLVLAQLRPQYSNVGLNSRRLELYPTVLQVATALIKLPPSLSADERVSVLKTCFDRVYHAASLMAGDDIIQTPDDLTGDIINMDVKWAEHMATILSCLNLLVQQLLLDTVTPATLDDIFTLLEPWLAKESSYQRAAAVSTLHSVLQCYLDNMNFGYETPSKFTQTGLILGRVVPRCTDPNLALRAEAVDCVRLVLSLAARYEGHIVDNDLTGDMSKLKEKIQTDDPKELFKVTSELAKIMCAKLPHFQLIHFCNSLLDALLDSEPCSSSGASVVLNVLLKSNGGELYHQVNDIMNVVLEKMENITCVQTRNGSVRVILSLAHHHLKAVISGLLNQPLPYAASVVECWTMLAQDHSLSADIIEHFLNAINGSQLYEEIHDKDKLRVVTLQPLASISAMHEMFRLATMQEIAVQRFPELFSCLLIAVGCYIGASAPVYTPRNANGRKDSASFIPNRNAYKLNPARMALDAFKSFLLCAKCESLAEALLLCTHIEMGDNLASFLDMMPSLVRSLCVRMPQSLPRLVTCLNQYGTSTYEPQRIVVIAFYAELINLNCNGQIILLESILNNMLNCGNDPSPIVRQLCLKGLSSIAHLEKEQMNRHYQPVLSALVQGLDDHDHNSIPLEAMRGFSRMLQAVDVSHVQGVQVSVALRIKPFFENENPNIREAAIRMFGDLAKYGGTSSKAAFQEQVSSNFVCLLLHLDDENKHVIKACKYALRQVSPLLGAEKINVMIQDHLIDVANLHYPDFVADLVKIMVEELPDLVPVQVMNALVYVKSAWPVIRGNAAMLIGLIAIIVSGLVTILLSFHSEDVSKMLVSIVSCFLYGSFPVSDGISKAVADTVCARLVLLLQDEDQSVRAKAAKALSCLVTE